MSKFSTAFGCEPEEFVKSHNLEEISALKIALSRLEDNVSRHNWHLAMAESYMPDEPGVTEYWMERAQKSLRRISTDNYFD